MKSLLYLTLVVGVVPCLAECMVRRLHRSSLPEEYYEDCDEPCSSYIPKRLPYYGRPRSPIRSYYDYPVYDSSSYGSSLNYLSTPHVVEAPKRIAGSVCGPLGTTLRGSIGCGGVSGSIVTPLGTALSGSIGHALPAAEPCHLCSHDLTAASYL